MNSSIFKFAGILAFGLLFRLLPFRPPNVEPILASQMPLARHSGALIGFLFGALSILLYDILTGTVGPWTLITASAYGILGLGAAWYFNGGKWGAHIPSRAKPRALPLLGATPLLPKTAVLPLLGENKIRRRQYVYFAIAGTLFYDAATGLTVGPLFFNQPFLAALLGQIPFTLMHLAGNVGFALTLSPIVEKLLKHRFQTDTPVSSLRIQEIRHSGFLLSLASLKLWRSGQE